MNNAPIFIVDDDLDELEIVQEIWDELGIENQLEIFTNPEELVTRLGQRVNPFLIISDVNLPKIDGFELRKLLAQEPTLSIKSIPFIFWSSTASDAQIKKAYDSGGHGFFFKGATYEEIKESLRLIIAYWKASKVPAISLAESSSAGQ